MHRPLPLNGEIILPESRAGQPAQPAPPAPKTLEAQIAEQLPPEEAKAAIAICQRLATEAKGIGAIGVEVFGLPDNEHGHNAANCRFYRLKVRSAAVATMYARAREARADMLVDEIVDIADAPLPDTADAVTLKAEVESRRLRIDARKWAAGKFNRGLYSDEPQRPGVQVNINNDNGASVLEEIRRRLARKRQALRARGDLPLRPEDDGQALAHRKAPGDAQ